MFRNVNTFLQIGPVAFIVSIILSKTTCVLRMRIINLGGLMKCFIVAALLASTFSFAEDSVSTVKELKLKSYKELTEVRKKSEIEKLYKMLIKKALPIKAEREKLAKTVNDEMGVEAVSLESAEIISLLNTGRDYQVNGYQGNDLKCETVVNESESFVLFESQAYKRSSSLAFGARFNVSSTSCINEDGERPAKLDQRVLVSVEFIDFVDLSKKLNEI